MNEKQTAALLTGEQITGLPAGTMMTIVSASNDLVESSLNRLVMKAATPEGVPIVIALYDGQSWGLNTFASVFTVVITK